VADLVSDFPEVLSINEERRALQVQGCNGALVAHLPFSERPW
jgi:hypothetical protein